MAKTLLLVLALVVSGAFLSRPVAQQSAPNQAELLAEVRLLRQAIESLAGVNARVQIVFGRLQLQEQRTTNASQRLDQARAESARVAREISGLQERQKDIEALIADNRRKPEEIEQLRSEGTMVGRLLEQMERDHVRATANETDAAGTLNQEQGRWSDLNRQLEELERALTKR